MTQRVIVLMVTKLFNMHCSAAVKMDKLLNGLRACILILLHASYFQQT